jgi:hypothetical protein
MSDSRAMSESEVRETIDAMVAALREPEPNPDVFRILYGKPLNAANMQKLLGSLAIRDAQMTFQSVGLERTHVDRVALQTFRHPDDLPDWNKASGQLLVDACTYVLVDAQTGVEELAALLVSVNGIVARGPEFTFRCLTDVLAHIRSLINGTGQGVVMVP